MASIKKYTFLLRKLLKDLSRRKWKRPLSDDVTSSILGTYYIVFEEDFNRLNGLLTGFDDDGIPLIKAYIDVDSDELFYYPITIGQYGLAVFNSYVQSGDEQKKEHFMAIAEWFYNEKIEDNKIGTYWLTEVPKPEYKVFEPWKSAFAQSRAISILMRAWQISGEKRFMDVATDALKPYEFDIKDGGVAIRRNKNETSYEEYVAEYPTRVLDGCIFSLFGLNDYVRATTDIADHSHAQAKRLLLEGLEGMKSLIPSYDMGYWLKYSLCEVPTYPAYDPCTISYLNLVISQLEILFKITQDQYWISKATEFEAYLGFSNIVKAYWLKYNALKSLNKL